MQSQGVKSQNTFKILLIESLFDSQAPIKGKSVSCEKGLII